MPEANTDDGWLGRVAQTGEKPRALGSLRDGQFERGARRSAFPLPSPPLLLVALCNVWPAGCTLALLDPLTGYVRWCRELRGQQYPLHATGGLVIQDAQVWAVAHTKGDASFLTSCDGDLNPTRHQRLPDQIGDAHDLRAFQNGWAIADTAHDRVMHVDPATSASETLWSASDADADTLHVNSVEVLDGKLFVSMIGPKTEGSWRNVADGAIVVCETGERIASGLRHPHSLIRVQDELWWCESAAARIWRWDVRRGARAFAQLKGYLRGLAVTQDYVFCAASARRTRSRHLGVDATEEATGLHVEESLLYIIHRRSGFVRVRSLMHIGAEVFALAPAPHLRHLRPTAGMAFAALRERFDAAAAGA